jgi:ABC-type Fe3+ transport system permease subunit
VFFLCKVVPGAPLWLELISCPVTAFVVVNDFDCASAHPFNEAERGRLHMASALAGTFIILSIGILMAHAMDAFRSGS